MPKLFSDPEAIAEDIIRDIGTNLVVGDNLASKANPGVAEQPTPERDASLDYLKLIFRL